MKKFQQSVAEIWGGFGMEKNPTKNIWMGGCGFLGSGEGGGLVNQSYYRARLLGG